MPAKPLFSNPPPHVETINQSHNRTPLYLSLGDLDPPQTKECTDDAPLADDSTKDYKTRSRCTPRGQKVSRKKMALAPGKARLSRLKRRTMNISPLLIHLELHTSSTGWRSGDGEIPPRLFEIAKTPKFENQNFPLMHKNT